MSKTAISLIMALGACGFAVAEPLPTADGFRGIWYSNQPTQDEYRYKYSGGMATYPQQHIPIAYYDAAANKTFFCYGGTAVAPAKRELLHMVSYFDHATGEVARPRILLAKHTTDAHDNPTIMLDDEGYVWIFSNAHGTSRPSYIHRSVRPHSIEEFELISKTNFSYSQPWHVPNEGFLFLHVLYQNGRRVLHWATSLDGHQWQPPQTLASIQQGHYQISWRDGSRVGTAFNFHPEKGGLNARTNLYYVETRDLGRSWQTIEGAAVQTPLTAISNPALVHEYQSEGLLVYLKDLTFDADGHPVILFLTSPGYESGPKNDPRTWRTARWTGTAWEIREFTTSDHNYDFGSLYIEPDGGWRIIAPTVNGPQAYNPGGEVAMWLSQDQGATWKLVRQLTKGSPYNHTYIRRPVHAHEEFYALWADGHARELSESSLYFTDQQGDHVWRLPRKTSGDMVRPEVAW